jgi:hypothetical protein
VVAALINKRSEFEKAFLAFMVSDQLIQQKAAAQKLVDAIVAKLPAYVPGVIGTTLAGPILANLDKAVLAYSPPG